MKKLVNSFSPIGPLVTAAAKVNMLEELHESIKPFDILLQKTNIIGGIKLWHVIQDQAGNYLVV